MALFPCGKGGGPGVAHGYKGKGVLIHLLVDAEGMPLSACSAPANEDERKHVGKLLETVSVKTGKAGRPRKNVRRLAADKGYDADALRNFLKKKGIQPQIPRKKECREKTETAQCTAVRHDFKSEEPSHGCKESSGCSSCDGNDC